MGRGREFQAANGRRSSFAALALVLAVIGVYGVSAFAVGRRRREIALRMAMGARARDIFTQVTAGALRRAILGVSAGLALAAVSAPLLQPLVFQTAPRDTATYAAVAAVLLIGAFAAPRCPPDARPASIRQLLSAKNKLQASYGNQQLTPFDVGKLTITAHGFLEVRAQRTTHLGIGNASSEDIF